MTAPQVVLGDVRVLSPGPPAHRFRGDVVISGGSVVSLHPAGEGTPATGERIECDGRWLLPAFADSHLHLDTLGQQKSVVRLPRRLSAEEFAGLLRNVTGDGWLVAQGWEDPLAELLRPNPRSFLDAVRPDRPVWAFAYDHHRAFLNSAALEAVGASLANSDGVLLEKDLERAWHRVPPLPVDPERVVADLHRYGVSAATSFDGTAARARWERASAQGRITLRIRHSIPEVEFTARVGGDLPPPQLDRASWFLTPWVKLFFDGTLGSRTAWMKQPYTDLPQSFGDERIAATSRDGLADAIGASGWGVCIHAIGDAAFGAALDAIERVHAARAVRGSSGVDRIEHGQCLDLEDLPRLAGIGAVVSMQPCHLLEDAQVAPERWGDRCRGAFAARSLIRGGIPIVFGSDAPIETVDPWIDIGAAVDRVDRRGRFPSGWLPDQCISFDEALAARTSAAADANLLPRGWGRIEPGSPADLQILGCEDPAQVRTIGQARLERLLVGGEWQRLSEGVAP